MNLSNITTLEISKYINNGCLTNSKCYELCTQTKYNITFEPFILLAFSILFSFLAHTILINYDFLINKYPKHKYLFQKLYNVLFGCSIISQIGLASWVLYLMTYGIN